LRQATCALRLDEEPFADTVADYLLVLLFTGYGAVRRRGSHGTGVDLQEATSTNRRHQEP